MGLFVMFAGIVTIVHAEEKLDIYKQLETPRELGVQTLNDTTNYAPSGNNILTVKVVDAVTGAPVPDCMIFVRSNKFSNEKQQVYRAEEGKTDAGGARVFATLYPMSYSLMVEATGYERLNQEVDLSRGTGAAEIRLKSASGKLAGRVVDEISKKALSNVEVSINSGEDVAKTDAQGEFVLTKVSKQGRSGYIFFQKEGYVSKGYDFYPEKIKADNMGEISLIQMASLNGILMGANRSIIGNTVIYLISEKDYDTSVANKVNLDQYKGTILEKQAVTQLNGNFNIKEIDPGSYVILFGEGHYNMLRIKLQPGENKEVKLVRQK